MYIFLKKFLFLFILIFVLSSCDENDCIEADDFGEYQYKNIEIDSVAAHSCEWTEGGSFECSDAYAVIPNTKWITHNGNKEGNTSSTDITLLSENSSFSLQALGTLNLLNNINDTLSLSVNSNQTIFENYFFKQSVNFSLSGKWCADGDVENCDVNSMIGEFQESNNMQGRAEFLRRGVLVLRSLPDGGFADNLNNYTGPLRDPEFQYWNCSLNSIGANINETTDYTCSEGYNSIKFNSEEDRIKTEELYPIDYDFTKNIGGPVIPKNNISHITPEVPFTETYCDTDNSFIGSSVRKCYTNSNKTTEITPYIYNEQSQNETIKQRRTKNSFLLSSDGLTSEFTYQTKLALKIIGENNMSGQCNAIIEISEKNSNNFSYLGTMNVKANNEWYTLNEEILSPSKYYTLKDNSLGEVDFNEFYKVRITFDANDIWKDEEDNEISCGEGMVAFFIPQNEITIKNSGFINFRNLLTDSASVSCNSTSNLNHQCIDSKYLNLKFSIINPLYNYNDTNIISKNFYEYSINNEPVEKSIDIPFNTNNWVGNFYVRKGQILRFNDENWYNISNDDDGGVIIQNKIVVLNDGIKKNVSHIPFMKIDERLALFCDGYETEKHTEYYIEEDTSFLEEVDIENSLIQCYDLEDYKGAFKNLFKYSSTSLKCSNVDICGALSEEDEDLGAKKLQSIFTNQNYGNFSNFEFITNKDSFDNKIYEYNGNLSIAEPKQVGLMVIDNENFDFTNNSYNNSGDYNLNFSSLEYETNGEQLAIILAHKDWQEKDGFNSNLFYNWVVKYDVDNSINSANYGNISSSTPYEFDKNGVLFKTGTNNSEVLINPNNFPGLSNLYSYNDLRVFFKIIDKKESEDSLCSYNGEIGTYISEVLCKCSNEPDTKYRDCNTDITCNIGKNIEYKEFRSCSDSYTNNSGYYDVQAKFNLDTKTANTASFLNYFIKPVLALLDGNNVKLKTDTNGDLIPCQSSEYAEFIGQNTFTEQDMEQCIFDGKNGTGACFFISSENIPNTKNCSLYYRDQYYKDAVGDNCGVGQNYYENSFKSYRKKGTPICYENCNDIVGTQSLTLCKNFSDGTGFTEKFYKAVITDKAYQTIVRVCFALSFSFYGLYFLLGLANFTASDLIKRGIKFSFIYLMITESGWEIYNQFFVTFFKEGIDYILFSVAGAFSDDSVLQTSIQLGEFNDKTVLFTPLDSLLQLMISEPLAEKIWALWSIHWIIGFFYIILVYISFFYLIAAMATTVLLYVTAQFFVSLLLSFGPIFFVLLIFDKTKGMFDKWLSNLISYSLAQIFLITVATLFTSLAIESIKSVFYYRVCDSKIQGTGSGSSALYTTPNIFQILFLLLLGSLMKKFVTFMNDLGGGLGGGAVSASQLSSSISGPVSKFAGDVKSGFTSLVGGGFKKLGFESAEMEKERTSNQRILRGGVRNAVRQARTDAQKFARDETNFSGLTEKQKEKAIQRHYSERYNEYLEGDKKASKAMDKLGYSVEDTKNERYTKNLYEASTVGSFFMHNLISKNYKHNFYNQDNIIKKEEPSND